MDPTKIKAAFDVLLDVLALETGQDRDGEDVAEHVLAAAGGYYAGCTGKSAAEFLSACPTEMWVAGLRGPKGQA